MEKYEYNILSPDGIYISYDNFDSPEEAISYMRIWIDCFKQQGYYSSTKYGLIDLDHLAAYCKLTKLDIVD